MADDDLILPHNQRHYLYIDGWTKEDDIMLVDHMLALKQDAQRRGTPIEFDGQFAMDAFYVLAEEFNNWHDATSIFERIQFLRKRYNMFLFVVHHEGTEWTPRMTYVKAKDVVWRRIFKVRQYNLHLLFISVSYTYGSPDSQNHDI